MLEILEYLVFFIISNYHLISNLSQIIPKINYLSILYTNKIIYSNQ